MKTFKGAGFMLLLVLIALMPSQTWAKRTITGQVTMPDGTPAKDMLVIAWDEDGMGQIQDPLGVADPPGNDALGHAVTDSQGRYVIEYPGNDNGRKWDYALPGSTAWRPDIFLTVFAVQSSESTQSSRMLDRYVMSFSSSASSGSGPVGEWRVYLVKKTGTKENWMMSRDIANWNIPVPGITGRVTYANGAPVVGLKVQAWDRDPVWPPSYLLSEQTNFSPHDLLSEATTAPDGRYLMLVPGGHKDSSPPNPIGAVVSIATGYPVGEIVDALTDSAWASLMHRYLTTWRPDIFIAVYDSNGNPVKTSDVYNNWPHRKTLTVNFTVPDHVSSDFRLAWFIPLIN